MKIKKGLILKATRAPNTFWASLFYDPECPFYIVNRIINGPEDRIVELIPLSDKTFKVTQSINRKCIPVYLESIKRCFEVSSFEEATAYLL